MLTSDLLDYGDMLGRDPEDRPPGTLVGLGRAILSNRISHFLNIKGPRCVKLHCDLMVLLTFWGNQCYTRHRMLGNSSRN